ncbi:MAG: restriction endonuclease subunit S [Pseudoxanthomonas sp.]
MTKLAEVCLRTETVDPQKSPQQTFEYVDVSGVSNQTFRIETTSQLLGKDAPSRARKLIETGDVIFATVRPTLMRVAKIPSALHRQVCSTGYIVLRAGNELDPSYLFYSLFRAEFSEAMEKLQKGASYPAVTDKQVLQQEIPLPPLDEQKRIVAKLDQAFAALDRARAHAEANLADAGEIRDLVISTAIDHAASEATDSIRLGALCNIARGGSPRPIQKFLTPEKTGINWIKISDATASGKFIDATKERIIKEGASRSRFVTSGSFLLTNSMSFGRPYILRTDGCIHDGWLVLEPDYTKVDQDYLYHLLGSRRMFQEFDRLAAGSTVRNLNINLVSNVVVDLPPLQKQREAVKSIESGIEKCSDLAGNYRTQLADIATLRQSLLQQAFSGRLA